MNQIYQPLSPRDCRLLFCVPGLHHRDLRFIFVHTDSLSNFPYTAISYTWGSASSRKRVIWINGQALMINPNLWACLHSLRRSWSYIWADALCINQGDIQERNQQVRIMDTIYTNAKVVSVWLGQVPISPHLGITVTEDDDLEIDEFDWPEHIQDLANRPYWSRTWVIQEFLLAQSIRLYCSNHDVDELCFKEILSLSLGGRLNVHDPIGHVAKGYAVQRWRALPLLTARDADQYPALRQPLYDLLVMHQMSQSTDPRDKVFALISLVLLDERSCLLRYLPDYDLSMDQVRVTTIAHVIQFPTDGKPRCLRPVLKALGVTRKEKAHELIERAYRIDYLGCDFGMMHVVAQMLEEPSTYSVDMLSFDLSHKFQDWNLVLCADILESTFYPDTISGETEQKESVASGKMSKSASWQDWYV